MDPVEMEQDPNPEAATSQELLSSVFVADAAEDELSLEREEYRIRIPSFEGPLDLLLHLIRKEQLDIYDIPISRICRSYLEHLELMTQFDVNVAGEFMVMAATLTYIKSQTLLPKEEVDDIEDDPRMPLVQQLLEYERYKEAAQNINEINWLYRDIYPRPLAAIQQMIPPEALKNAPVEPIDTFQLLLGLKASLDRTERKPYEIRTPPLSLRDAVSKMKEELAHHERVTFSELITGGERKRKIIMNFLAILELARLKFIQILQHETFGPIQIQSVRQLDIDMSLLDQY